ncbi:uncharacterized protein FYW47_015315 [Aplochiton taeniatus]
MPVQYMGWKVISEKKRVLKPGQKPSRSRGYTMYHGTHRSNADAIITGGFRCSGGGTLGPGVYCSRDIAKAKGYPGFCSDQDRVVFQLNVRVGRVKRMDMQNSQMWSTWHQNGYDTAWLPPGLGSHEEDCVADPKRVTVTGIAHCADAANKRALEQLISQQGKGRVVQGGQGQSKCKGCGIQTQDSHPKEACWGCNSTICPFMDQHVCKK